jgi:TIR domain
MRIFLSYRREDAAAWAGRLHDSLAASFGDQNIFQDVTAIRAGEDFTAAIDRALDQSDVALAVIGPRWVSITDTDGTPRLERHDDYVRSELLASLAHKLRVIPVLVGGAAMPDSSQLPVELQPLARHQAVAVRDAAWHQDVDGLIRELRGEQPTPPRSKRWIVVAAVAAVLILTAVAARLALGGRDSGGDSGDDGSLTGCPTPAEPDWDMIDLDGAPAGQVAVADGTWRFEVNEGGHRRGSGLWDVVLLVTAANETGPNWNNDAAIYELVIDGVEYAPSCVTVVAGNNPLGQGSSNDALVGFEVTRDPAASDSLALDVDYGGAPQRIELTPSTAG